MKDYIIAAGRDKNYISQKKQQCDMILNRPNIVSAFEKEAFERKWEKLSSKEKIKLILKKAARSLGIKKSLFTADYMLEEDIRQCFQDMEIYCNILKTPNITADPEQIYDLSGKRETEQLQLCSGDWIKSLKYLLTEHNTYIAIMVKTLDSGGLEQVVKLLASQLHINGIALKIFCTEHGGKTAEELLKEGIEVIEFHRNKSSFRNYLKRNCPLLINTHFASDFYEIINQFQIPIVEVIHNMYVFLTDKQLEAEKRKSTYIAHYIAVSEMAREIFCCKIPQVSRDRITVIGNACTQEEYFFTEQKSVRNSFGIPEDAFVFLMVGSIDARKNQLAVLRALDIVRHLTDERIFLVFAGGETDSEYREKLKRLIETCSLRDSISFLGHTDHIFQIMNASDVMVVNSYYEGWSMAATEALFCGLPLIHSECGSGRELIAGGENGILIDNPVRNISSIDSVELYNAMHMGISENMTQLVSAMLSVLKNKDIWVKRRDKIRNYAETHFSITNMIIQYAEIFNECSRKT